MENYANVYNIEMFIQAIFRYIEVIINKIP